MHHCRVVVAAVIVVVVLSVGLIPITSQPLAWQWTLFLDVLKRVHHPIHSWACLICIFLHVNFFFLDPRHN